MLEVSRVPRKLDAIFYLCRAAVLLLLGLIIVFSIKQEVTELGRLNAGLSLTGAILLLSLGASALFIAIRKVLRKYESKIPRDNLMLSAESDLAERNKTLVGMLMTLANPTFQRPSENSCQHILETMAHRLTYTPPYIRAIALNVFEQSIRSASLYIIFFLAIFSGLSGLSNFTSTPSADYMVCLLLIQQILLWSKTFSSSRNTKLPTSSTSILGLVVLPVVLAILIPSSIMYISLTTHIPKLPIYCYDLFFLQTFLTILIVGFTIIAITCRIPSQIPEETISRELLTLSATIHPNELFIYLEKVMDRFGYRKYIETKPVLKSEGSDNKGNFSGEALYETPTTSTSMERPPWFKGIALAMSLFAHILFIIAGITIFNCSYFPQDLSITAMSRAIIFSCILFCYSRIIIYIKGFFEEEKFYKSDLVYLSMEGNYNEIQVSCGNRAVDSIRSSNTQVHSDISFRLMVCEINTASLTDNGARYIEKINSNDVLFNNIIDAFHSSMDNKSRIGQFSARDLEAISNIAGMNQQIQNIGSDNLIFPPADRKNIKS